MMGKQQLERFDAFLGDSSKDIVFYDSKNDTGNQNRIVSVVKSRFFKLEKFDETLAQGYIKLIKTDKGLGIQVIDTYNKESKEEEEKYLALGYIKIGYPQKQENSNEKI